LLILFINRYFFMAQNMIDKHYTATPVPTTYAMVLTIQCVHISYWVFGVFNTNINEKFLVFNFKMHVCIFWIYLRVENHGRHGLTRPTRWACFWMTIMCSLLQKTVSFQQNSCIQKIICSKSYSLEFKNETAKLVI